MEMKKFLLTATNFSLIFNDLIDIAQSKNDTMGVTPLVLKQFSRASLATFNDDEEDENSDNADNQNNVHDENENNKLDTNFLGIPKESFGCSNNAKGFMGPPKWEDAKFEISNKDVVQNIELKKLNQ